MVPDMTEKYEQKYANIRIGNVYCVVNVEREAG